MALICASSRQELSAVFISIYVYTLMYALKENAKDVILAIFIQKSF